MTDVPTSVQERVNFIEVQLDGLQFVMGADLRLEKSELIFRVYCANERSRSVETIVTDVLAIASDRGAVFKVALVVLPDEISTRRQLLEWLPKGTPLWQKIQLR